VVLLWRSRRPISLGVREKPDSEPWFEICEKDLRLPSGLVGLAGSSRFRGSEVEPSGLLLDPSLLDGFDSVRFFLLSGGGGIPGGTATVIEGLRELGLLGAGLEEIDGLREGGFMLVKAISTAAFRFCAVREGVFIILRVVSCTSS
jgi:hypothetical protein